MEDAETINPVVVLVTTSSEEEAIAIGRQLVEERVVACANVMPEIRSIYRWQGELADEVEWLLLLKTRRSCFQEVERRVQALHSYDVPEVIALPIVAGSSAYINWLNSEIFES